MIHSERTRIIESLLTETQNQEEEKKNLTEKYRKLKTAYEAKVNQLDGFKSKIRSKMSDRTQLKKTLDDVERSVSFICIFILTDLLL